MATKEIVQSYSCARKRDYMTVFAICFFFLIVAAELYLVFFVPVQLQRENVLQKHIARESVVKLLDSLRQQTSGLARRTSKPSNLEIHLVSQVLDDYAQYARNNLEKLSLEELLELIELVKPYGMYAARWNRKQFIFKEEKIPPQRFSGDLEKKYNL
ncbi:MAG: hypothetical protein J6S58_03150 [Lentisphaeria bacterium]|nr:hypothetical protein [Lentisphaeria bacterium]